MTYFPIFGKNEDAKGGESMLLLFGEDFKHVIISHITWLDDTGQLTEYKKGKFDSRMGQLLYS